MARFSHELQVPEARSDQPLSIETIGGHAVPVFDVPGATAHKPILTWKRAGGTTPVASVHEDGIRFGFDFWSTLGSFLNDSCSRLPSDSGIKLSVPTVDLLEESVLRSLSARFGPIHNMWPRNARFALGLSHDVDRIRKTFQYVTHSLRELRQGKLRRAISLAVPSSPEPYWCFDDIEALERGHNVVSTFFFLHEAPTHRPTSLKDRAMMSGVTRLDIEAVANEVAHLSENGWEIGLHSSSFVKHDQSRLQYEKELLDRLVGGRTKGVRQHMLAPDVSSLWPPQCAANFVYDTTMGFSGRVGYRAGTTLPYIVEESKEFCELPFEIMDGALLGSSDPWVECSNVLDSVESAGGALVLLWHQRFFNEREFPGFRSLYDRIIRESRARGAWIAPLGEIVNWWRGPGE